MPRLFFRLAFGKNPFVSAELLPTDGCFPLPAIASYDCPAGAARDTSTEFEQNPVAAAWIFPFDGIAAKNTTGATFKTAISHQTGLAIVF